MTTVNTWASRILRAAVVLHACLLIALSAFRRQALMSPAGLKAQVWIMCLLGLLLFADLITQPAPGRKNSKVLDTILFFLWLILLVAGVTIAVGTGLV